MKYERKSSSFETLKNENQCFKCTHSTYDQYKGLECTNPLGCYGDQRIGKPICREYKAE